MMFAVITMVISADSKEQLDSDTEAILSVARKHMCQLATLKFQQLDGLNTVLPIGTRKNQCVSHLNHGITCGFYAFQSTRDSR